MCTMPDSVWVIVLALAIPNLVKHGIVSMLAGAVCVMLPQLALAVIPPHRTLGGADTVHWRSCSASQAD